MSLNQISVGSLKSVDRQYRAWEESRAKAQIDAVILRAEQAVTVINIKPQKKGGKWSSLRSFLGSVSGFFSNVPSIRG